MDHILTIGSDKPEVTLFSGSIGRAYHALYEPIMPYKDELERILEPDSISTKQKDLKLG